MSGSQKLGNSPDQQALEFIAGQDFSLEKPLRERVELFPVGV
ncbi:MAG: hypothetical protein ACKVOX_06360 [Rhizobacter sp.]